MATGDVTNKDHVPPSGLFLAADRDFPLILTTHYACNQAQSSDDETIKQLVGILHGQMPDFRAKKMELWVGPPGANPQLAVGGFNLRRIIRRWVRGFHAALYREPLVDDEERFMTFPPLPEGQQVAGQFKPVPVPEVIPELVRLLRRNRATNTLDRMVCRRGQCQYECVWAQSDSGQWFCAYGLKLYDWSMLGSTAPSERRGCVGAYWRRDGCAPLGASLTTSLDFEVAAGLDPFTES